MNFKSTAVALALVAGTGWASAQEDVSPITVTLTPTTGGVLSGSFTESVSGLFVETFAISPGPFRGPVSVSFDAPDSVSFFAAILGDQTFSYLPENEATNDFKFTATVNSVGPLTLTVLGFAGTTGFDRRGVETGEGLMESSSSSTLTVVAIPEPETYALMLAGLAVVGVWSRRKRG